MYGEETIECHRVVPFRKRIPRGEEIGADPITGRPFYLARPGEPIDQLRRPLEPHLYTVFADGVQMRALVQNLNEILQQLNEIKTRHACTHLCGDTIALHLETARDDLARAAPYCVCPSCGGVGKQSDQRQAACPTCGGADFIHAGGFGNLNADLQAVANGYGDPPFIPVRRPIDDDLDE